MSGPLLPGDPHRLGGIRLLGRLGAGGMGLVYLGRTAGGRLVAVKTVHAHLATEPHYRERFRREARAACAVTGAYTAAVLDADPGAAVPWLATAFLPGVTLRRAVASCGPLPPAAVRALGAALAEALAAIHTAGIVHRDLKPSNVLVTSDGPRVIDFGIARQSGGTHSAHAPLTAADDIIGTPGFLAPEQIEEGTAITAAADVFALGAVLAFAATGANPFGEGNAAIMLYRAVHDEPDLSEVPGGVRELLGRCLAKRPYSRPTVQEVLAALRDSGAPLWWREGAVGELVRNAQTEPAAAPPDPEPDAEPDPEPDAEPDVNPEPAWAPPPPPVDGKRHWRERTTGLEANWRTLPGGGHTPTTHRDTVFHWPDQATVQAFDLVTRRPRWQRAVVAKGSAGGGTGPRPPVVADGTVYAATGSTCAALDINDGRVTGSWGTAGTITDLAADTTGWYARLDKRTVQAWNRTAG